MEQDPVETSNEVLQRLLDERFLYAASRPGPSYKHVFRSKSFLELVRLSLLALAIECFYATEVAFLAPILFSLGLPYTLMSMMWALPPIVGMLVIPAIGSVSDRSRLAWGRRRPAILALGIAVLLAMMLIPCGAVFAPTIGLDHLVWMVALTAVVVLERPMLSVEPLPWRFAQYRTMPVYLML
uniref:MFS transporter n=1 Tax=Anopheles albimanus TaxID=7167 RepID=A0A182FLH3_ANOAL